MLGTSLQDNGRAVNECDFCGSSRSVRTDKGGETLCRTCRIEDRERLAEVRNGWTEWVPEFDSEPLSLEESFHNDELRRELEDDWGWA